jgi:ubiquinone/menaquinone biosynthesis C-methylase UbiE
MQSDSLSDRQKSELHFHDDWAKSINLDELLVSESFEAATALENSYAMSQMEPIAGKTILDLGCGAGETSVYFALHGALVSAVDISPVMLAVAQKLAGKFGVTIETKTTVAEKLPFEQDHFDYVFGNGVLHHVDYEKALEEVHRVLKPGGKAIFIEPLSYNPAIEVYRRLAKTVRTPMEKPFYFSHLNRMKKKFARLQHREFWFSTLLMFVYFFVIDLSHPSRDRYWKKVIVDSERLAWLFVPLNRLDNVLLGVFPFLRWLCWNTVITLQK